jgi:predicted ribosome quality control (RQC) complex YloA/Tae2 family protein
MDAITLAAVRRELDETLTGGRVQAVLQPDEHSLALELFRDGRRHWLLLSVDARAPRAHLLDEKARRGMERDTPFLLQARKRLRRARLTGVIQPGWERLLYLAFAHPEQGKSVLAAEIMGRWSNLALNDDQGDVLTSLRHFERSERSQRIVRPGHPYQPPPPQARKLPLDLMREEDMARLLHQTPAGTPMWRALVAALAGLSPLAAREIVFRATGDALADVSHPNLSPAGLSGVLDWFRSLPQQGGWAPTVAMDETDAPAAFAPYELTHLGRLRYFDGISAAARRYYDATLGGDSYAGRRKQVLALIDQARKKLLGRRASLGEQAAGEEDVARLRAFGEWILAYAWQIKPGDAELLADTGEETLHIPLDPTLSPSENAQTYFARYHKKKRAAEKIPVLLAAVDRDLAWLDQIESDVRLADNTPQIEELREALLASGLVSETRGKRPKPPRSRPIRITTPEGFEVVIGRNALQNERVTWKMAGPDDIWLHAEGVPGSHVIISAQGRQIPEEVIEQAAGWALWHSQARESTKAPVIVTRKRHLRKIKGGRPGQVRVLQLRSITVRPDEPPAG